MDSYERIRQLREDYESVLDEVERVREKYHHEIVKIHRSGASLREIADALGMSHQRVHQIVAPHEARPRSRKRTAIVAGLITTLLVVALGGVLVTRDWTVDRPTPGETPSPEARLQALPAVEFGCRIAPTGSTLRMITIAAECQRSIDDLLRDRRADVGLVVLDPRTGRIIAVVSGGGHETRPLDGLGAS